MGRAQIQSQVLVYILAVIIMAMILIFGYKALIDMKDRARMAQLIQFRSELKSEITSIGLDYGTSKLESFRPPADYRQVCFVNLDHTYEGVNDALLQVEEDLAQVEYIRGRAIIKDGVRDMVSNGLVRKNMFLCPPCSDQEYVGNITILDKDGADTAFRCFGLSQGTLTLRISGLGDRAEISSDKS